MAVAELEPLAAQSDVLVALGFPADSVVATVLPVTMQVRMPTTLARVSRRFRKEAQRIFTPGTYTHRLLIHCGATRLMEVPNEVQSVRVLGSDGVIPGPTYTVEGQWLQWADWNFWGLNGREVEVTYSWDTEVPRDVVATVADITARNLLINPMGAERQSKALQSRHFRQEMADWVMSGGTGFTKDDIEEARSYRSVLPPVIIANVSQFGRSPASSFSEDNSW